MSPTLELSASWFALSVGYLAVGPAFPEYQLVPDDATRDRRHHRPTPLEGASVSEIIGRAPHQHLHRYDDEEHPHEPLERDEPTLAQ